VKSPVFATYQLAIKFLLQRRLYYGFTFRCLGKAVVCAEPI
jgi:hypothetical protein